MTVGNSHVGDNIGGTVGNHHITQDVDEVDTDDPTTDGNGDVTVTHTNVRLVEDQDEVLGVEITGAFRAQVQSVSQNQVTVRITEPDGAGGFQAVTGTTLTGETLTTRVLG